MGDWPVKELLKRHFRNQRSYDRRVRRARAAVANGKKPVPVVDLDRDGGFGTDDEMRVD